MIINDKTYNKILEELKIKFGNVEILKMDNKRLVTVISDNMILETHKKSNYFHGAIMFCDNYSIKIENEKLVFVFGFIINN